MKLSLQRSIMLLAAISSLTICALSAFAQGKNPVTSPLSGLFLPQEGTAKHEGSWDRSGGNGDMRGVAPGETLTLLDYKGAGIIRRFWVTIAPRSEKNIHRQAILRMYWDDEKTPSVEVPIGDFFGVGFGEQKDYISMPLNETSGGYNCYWPMPFHKTARWTLTNMSKVRIDAFYYNIDFTAYKSLAKDVKLFHAQWRRENPTKRGKNYTILEATGDGHYVGTALFMQGRKKGSLGFLEGDENVYIDGETKPSIIGTGTEDYFSSGWYYDRGPYSAPYHGLTLKDEENSRISTYRWHIEDAMPFHKSIKFTIEHGSENDTSADYSSVAYWYQSEPHAAFPLFPTDPAKLLPWSPPPPLHLPNAIEGESLIPQAKASTGSVTAQDMGSYDGEWSNNKQLFWQPAGPDATLTLNIPIETAGRYNVTAYLTRASDYGKIIVSLNGVEFNAELDLYAKNVEPTGPMPIGELKIPAGNNTVVIKISGKNPDSKGYLVGIDAVTLEPIK